MAKENPLQANLELIEYFCKYTKDGKPSGMMAISKTSHDTTACVDEGNKTAETWSYKPPEQN